MPPVLIPIVASAITAAGVTATVATIAANVLVYAALTAASIGLSMLLQPRAKREKTDAGQLQVKQPLPPRVRAYGTTKLGGAVCFIETNGNLQQALIHCEGPIDSYREWWFADKDSGIPGGALGGTNSASPWEGWVTVESHLGTATQPVSPLLNGMYGSGWSVDHRLRGLAYSVVQYALPFRPRDNFQRVYPSGPPGLRVVVKAALVYDARMPGQSASNPATWAWSDNPAWCIRDFLTSSRGMNIPASRMNIASFTAFANLCDEAVPLKAGGTEKRYRVGGSYDLTEEPREVLRRLLEACDGELVPFADGTVGIRGGRWDAPTVTITDDHILAYDIAQGSDRLAAFNRLKLSFISPLHDYQPTETESWEDLENQVLTGQVLVQDLTLSMVQSHGQARRLAKITTRKGNPRWRLRLTTNLVGLDALGERTVRVTLADLGIDETFLVNGFEVGADLVTCNLDLTSLDASAYAWNAAAEEGTPPPVAGGTAAVFKAPNPSGVVGSIVRRDLGSSVFEMSLRVTVAPIVGGTLPYTTLGRYRQQGTTPWITMQPDGDYAVVSGVLENGKTYEYQVAHSTAATEGAATQSDWSPVASLFAQSDPVAPGPPVGFVGTGGVNQAALAWTTPNSPNHSRSLVYRAPAGTAFGGATEIRAIQGSPNQAHDIQDTGLTAGDYSYWVRAVNGSGFGDASSTAGPLAITVTAPDTGGGGS